MRKVKLLGVIFICMLFVSCVGPNINLTPDQQARASIDYYQRQVKVNMANTEIFLRAHPDKIAKYETEILPLFKQLNTEINKLITTAKTGSLNVGGVEDLLQPILNQIIVKLFEIGAKK